MKVGHLDFDDARLREFCEKWGVAELAVFGSVLRDDFRPDSDVDFLVTWLPGRTPRAWREIWEMKEEMGELVGREAGFAQRAVVEADRNHYRRKAILTSARTIYAAA